jgi:chromosomal replication initiation ATPase DnaA
MGYREPTIEDIKKAVADVCNIHVRDLESPLRAHRVLQARAVAIALSSRLTQRPSTAIARAFRKEASTVRHMIRLVTPALDRIELRLAREAPLRLWIDAAMTEIDVTPKRRAD